VVGWLVARTLTSGVDWLCGHPDGQATMADGAANPLSYGSCGLSFVATLAFWAYNRSWNQMWCEAHAPNHMLLSLATVR
jgi:hypothetical protein